MKKTKSIKGDLYYSPIIKLSKMIRDRELSPVEIVDQCLQRIRELNPALNAFITILDVQARQQAKEAENEIRAGKWRGPLHGIPIGIKDFYDTAGIPTTAAFEYFKDRIPAKDAPGVAKLKEAGAVIIGKTNMHQLGMGTTGLESYFGPVQNPWHAGYIPGGSSSGSAAAVASGLCFATMDTDVIGSCRLPAACCGVVGFKGTYGLIRVGGILEGEQPPDEVIRWLGHVGITARNVEDLTIVLNVLASPHENAETDDFFGELTHESKLKVGAGNNFKADEEVTQSFAKAVERIGNLGHNILSTDIPFGDPAGGIKNIETDRKTIVSQAFDGIDLLLLPTTTTTVLTVKEADSNPQALSPGNTSFANYYGLPAITVPCGKDRRGLPIGLQIVGKPWHEGDVLQLAYQYQEAMGYSKKHPVIR